MATSGWLITGVETIPPSVPSELRVMVEPDNSSRGAVPALAALDTRASSRAQSQMPRASAWRTTGTISPPGVWVAMPM